jgi:hypothetical protein
VGGFNVGPYLANLDGFNAQQGVLGTATINNAIIWCVDFSHVATTTKDTYFETAFASNKVGVAGNGDFSKTRMNSAEAYLKAAYLIEKYDSFNGTSTTYSASNVQGTIWTLFGASGLTGYTDLAASIPTGASLKVNNSWYVLSDDPCEGFASAKCLADSGSHQEYLTSRPQSTVPEPSTYALMGVGLLSVGFMSRRRRNRAALVA